MTLSLLAAVGTALAYGVGSVLQAVGSRSAAEPDADGEVRGLIDGLLRQLPFLIGLGLDGVGLALSVYALRSLPLFVVQAAVAAAVAVTAVTAMLVLHAKLNRNDWIAISAVIVGLALLAAAAGVERPVETSLGFRFGLVALALVAAAVAWWLAERTEGSAAALGAIAGLGYGVAAVGVRVTVSFAPADLVTNPAVLAALIGGATGILALAVALRRGAVTVVTGALTAAETVLPSLLGLFVLDERPKAGWWPVAVAGFALTVGGAFALSRFGEAADMDSEEGAVQPSAEAHTGSP